MLLPIIILILLANANKLPANVQCLIDREHGLDAIHQNHFMDTIQVWDNRPVQLLVNASNDHECFVVSKIVYQFWIQNNYSNTSFVDAINRFCVGSCLVPDMNTYITSQIGLNVRFYVPAITEIIYEIRVYYQFGKVNMTEINVPNDQIGVPNDQTDVRITFVVSFLAITLLLVWTQREKNLIVY